MFQPTFFLPRPSQTTSTGDKRLSVHTPDILSSRLGVSAILEDPNRHSGRLSPTFAFKTPLRPPL
jgi:hypothetical protein